MKKILLILTILVVPAALLAQTKTKKKATPAKVKVKTTTTTNTPADPPPPYKKTLLIPSFELRNIVDSSLFTNANLDKTKRTIFIYFGPECGHCTVFAKKMMDSLDLFKNTQIIMVSSFAFDKIKKFYEENNIASCPFITMGQDKDYFFISHYGIRQFPSAYVYNKAGKFVKAYTSEINIFELAAEK